MRRYKSKIDINKITFFIIGAGLITAILIARMFQLQVLEHNYYQDLATKSQFGSIELPAQRGEILIKDFHSGDESLLATNTTLDLIYADPTLIKDPEFVASQIAPLIFDIEFERAADDERIREQAKVLPPEMTEEEIEKLLKALDDSELEAKFKKELSEKIASKRRQQILLGTNFDQATLSKISSINAPGIEIINKNIYAYPPQISKPKTVAAQIADIIEIPSKRLEKVLKGENRYVVLKRKLEPAISEKVEELMKDDLFKGIGMQEEYFRFYPENKLGANILGYTNHKNIGQYGIESSFNTSLQGEEGTFQSKRDSVGRQITVGESVLKPAVDGDNILLTIDRSIQLRTERILEAAVKEHQADSGQIIIMNPQTGAITAMAHYPTFDPNKFGEVFKKIEVNLSPTEIEELYPTKNDGVYYLYKNPITLERYTIFEKKDKNGKSEYSRYENFTGPEVYHNKIISWPYEPGSVFKTVAMAAAIDDGDITPNTTYNDVGPVEVDFNIYSGKFDFKIKNSDGYYGLVNMTTVLSKSLNTGMTFISKEMGASLFYSYLKKFGFLDRTDIELEGESKGKIKFFENWTESELATHTFGQGLTVTMLQVANAYSSIINGGILMQPYIVDEIRHDDETITKTETHEIRRVISQETSDQMVTMLVNSTENGVANRGQVENHLVGGKTGTSQTYKRGQALTGVGTTITSFAGFGPVQDPQFVILVKLDRPQRSEWGSSTAAPTFSKVAEYLFDYYNIPPDK
ncbi:penicillin-binding protein 2 [Candidatus Gracilibacteria bacterium]|nr:penicillin-binding protein 2 [Candidatus Gracilibacteria bacterium]